MRKFLVWLLLKLLKGGEDVVAVYVTLIIYGRRTYESVPVQLQPAVKADLEAMGLGTDGSPLEADQK